MGSTKATAIHDDVMERCEAKTLPPFGFVLHRANRLFTRVLDAELRSLGVTSAQLGPLIVMAQEEKPMLQTELVRRSAIAQPAMASALALLTRNGFITRCRHEQDGRATVLQLTDHGRSVVEAALPILARCNERAVAGLPAAQRGELDRLLSIIIGNLGEADTASQG